MSRHIALPPRLRVHRSSYPQRVEAFGTHAVYMETFADEVLAERGWRHYRWSRLGLALRVLAVAPLVYLAAATATVAFLLTLEEVE